MRAIRELLLRLIGTFHRPRADDDLSDELRAHLDLAAEDARRRSGPQSESERAARIRAGGVSQAMDALRDQRGLPWLDVLRTDLARMPKLVRRHRGYFAFATTTLAVAVGVNLLVFTVVNALWLRPLPFPNADRLVTVADATFTGLGSPKLKPFEAVAGQVTTFGQWSERLLPELIFDRVGRNAETVAVTPGYFSVLGLTVRGRDFAADDDRVGAEPVAIISDRMWSREFDRRIDVVGAVAAAKPFPIRIIGIAPPEFCGARRGEQADVWIPSTLLPKVAPGADASATVTLMAFARMHPGQTPSGIMQQLRDSGADSPATGTGIAIIPLSDVFGSPQSPTIVIHEGRALGVVAGLALLVLVGGAATLTALVLVHYERRRRELAVRIALGATRTRLAGELIRELLVLAAAGTGGAILISMLGLRAMPSLSLPGGVDLGRLDLSVDWRVLSVAVLSTALTLIAATLLPMSRFTRAGVAGELLAGPATTSSASSQRVRQALLALHVCATFVVLVSAGLFVRAVVHGFARGSGFDVDRTLFASIPIEVGDLRSDNSGGMNLVALLAQRTASLREALRAVPGVDEVAVGTAPIGDDAARRLTTPVIAQVGTTSREVRMAFMSAGPELLRSLGVPILAGRALTEADMTTPANPPAGVITASLARLLWPDTDPIGHIVSLVGRGGRAEIVGIAGDFAYGSMTNPATGVVVIARSGMFGPQPQFVIHGANADALVEPIRRAATSAIPGTTWMKLATGREVVARDIGRQRLGAWFFSGFGLTALMLGVGGVFGLVAYLAEARRREFGVRLALGATPSDLVRHGLGAALTPVAFGVGAGLALAAILARLFTALLTGLSALDPLTYATVAATMLACAALAGLGGAWRLRRLVPVDALRIE